MGVSKIQFGEREIVIVGTAHISRNSAEEVERTIREVTPDTVCVELDDSRYRTLTDEKAWQSVNVAKLLRERKGLFLLANLVLSSFQRRMGLHLGVKQGEDMIKAIAVAKELAIPFRLCDRNIQITLKRAWAKAGFWGKNKMLGAMLGAIFAREDLSEQEIERLKERNVLEEMMGELAEYLPRAKQVLIDERDRYLATRIYESPGAKIVAVVGAGHLTGIERHMELLHEQRTHSDLADLDIIPPPGKVARIVPWAVPAAILGLVVVGFVRSGWELSLSMLWKWFLVNGTLSALGALLALAHPLTILMAFAAAPITSMNPTIGVGMFTGILEAALRKPRVVDFQNLHRDTTTIKGFFRNRFTHILLVFFLSSVGSSIGTFVAIPYLTSLLR